MNVFELTRALVDIDSITPNEKAVGDYLYAHLLPLADQYGGSVERFEVEQGRDNILASWGNPAVTLATHMDTVPPFFPSSDDGEQIWGRGACDTKGIIASMITAARELLAAGERNLAVLFVVGEERDSIGAKLMAKHPRGSRYLINGEPTENMLALGTKGTLRFEIAAKGRAAHSAYPHLGESAIEKLIDALQLLRKMPLPSDGLLGVSTLNIGLIGGGKAPNIIPDAAQADIFIRLVDDGTATRERVHATVKGLAEANEVLYTPAVRLGSLEGFDTTVVSYCTDIPAFAGVWGEPFLFGPGTIHLAHTAEERVAKKDLEAAVPHYKNLVRGLLRRSG